MKKIIFESQSKLSLKLGISVDSLQFIGMQPLALPNCAYMPLFNIIDKNSKLYMTTRAAHVFYKRNKTTDTYTEIKQYDWLATV